MSSESIDLLTSIKKPKSTWEKVFDWTFSVGRYMVIIVEAIVVLAFISRFTMDRIKYDLDQGIADAVKQLDFYKETGKTDRVMTTYYSLNGARALIDNQKLYSEFLAKSLELIGDKATLISVNVEDLKFRIIGRCPDLKTSQQIEDLFRSSEYFYNVQYDLLSVKGEGGQTEIEFTISGDLSREFFTQSPAVPVTVPVSSDNLPTSQ